MSNKVTLELLESFKDNKDIGFLNNIILKKINSLFLSSKTHKSKKKKINNNTKKQNLKKLKDNFESKINFLLNKLTNKNENEIILEFSKSISFESYQTYQEFIEIIWKKIIVHSSFINTYFDFLLKIIKIYSQVNEFETNFEPMINLIQDKFENDYLDSKKNRINEILKLPNTLTKKEKNIYFTNYKFNNLEIIKNLITRNILDEELSEYVSNILSSKSVYSEDLYNWFSNFETNDNLIIKYLSEFNEELENRNRYLIESLLIKKEKIHLKQEKKVQVKNDINELSVINLFEEYFFIKEVDEIYYFIEENCKNNNNKDLFVKYLLNYYLFNKEEYCSDIIDILSLLLKNKYIYKKNLQNSINFLVDSLETIKIDCLDYKNRLNSYFKFLKKIGINQKINF